MDKKEILTHLGAKSVSPTSYDKSLLEKVPRSINRVQYQIQGNEFVGTDLWHHYEVSCLTKQGLPISGLMKISIPADSQHIVESKSLKLYFNSFNMERLASTKALSIKMLKELVQSDLSKLLNAKVKSQFFDIDTETSNSALTEFLCIDTFDGAETLSFTDFHENPSLLATKQSTAKTQRIMSHLLRSNCKVTHQPDWGSVYIYIEGDKHIDELSLLQYIVSVRNENHFHEEICEMIYIRLLRTLTPSKLMVSCLYTRRGGIDICPIRATHKDLLPDIFVDINKLYCLPSRM
ncbi:MAG: NADPH-dependent 7-cyano-7-deazaguanine reductase QueF [Bacteroidales bacterium]